MSLLGVEKARETMEQLTNAAVNALSVFGEKGKELADFAVALANRNH